MLIVKEHINENRLVLAVCDPELIGRVFEQGNIVLDLTKKFYRGDLMPENEVVELMRSAYIMNLVGEKSVNLALKNNFISENFVFKIKNVPYAQYVNFSFR